MGCVIVPELRSQGGRAALGLVHLGPDRAWGPV